MMYHTAHQRRWSTLRWCRQWGWSSSGCWRSSVVGCGSMQIAQEHDIRSFQHIQAIQKRYRRGRRSMMALEWMLGTTIRRRSRSTRTKDRWSQHGPDTGKGRQLAVMGRHGCSLLGHERIIWITFSRCFCCWSSRWRWRWLVLCLPWFPCPSTCKESLVRFNLLIPIGCCWRRLTT